MIKGSCHCGAVRFQLDDTPEWLTECNCSICKRLGARWAHADAAKITIEKSESTSAYVWGDKSLAFHSCTTCGCTTHWESLQPGESTRMAVNCRMAEPDQIAGLRVRHFDGADSWCFLD